MIHDQGPRTKDQGPSRSLRLRDLAALVVGYGLAAGLVRAFWPSAGLPMNAEAILLGLEYLWLGLAMSGPIVLLFDPRPAPGRAPLGPPRRRVSDRGPASAAEGPGPDRREGPPSRYTRAELAWLLIGSYWIGILVVVVPGRYHGAPLSLLGMLQLLAAVLALGLVVRRPSPLAGGPSWTHHAAVGLLLSWPPAWVAMILLSKTLF